MDEPKRPMSEADLERLRHQSGVMLTRDGDFLYLGRPVENERVRELFHQGIDVRSDGKVVLQVGRFVAYPEVEGVARFVRRIAWDGAGHARAVLAGGREVELARAVLGYGPDDRFYLWFEGLRGPAVALREAHQALAGRLADGAEGEALAPGLLAAIPAADSLAPAVGAVLGAIERQNEPDA